MDNGYSNNHEQSQSQIRDYLARPDVRPAVVQIVTVWNACELLGIDLADSLRSFVAYTKVPLDLDSIDWGELAEDLAEEICAVRESELTARREAAG